MLNRRRTLGLGLLVLLMLPPSWADADDAEPALATTVGQVANLGMELFRGGGFEVRWRSHPNHRADGRGGSVRVTDRSFAKMGR